MKRLLAALLLAAAPAAAMTKSSYTHYLKALLLQRQGLYDEALREYQAVVTIDPDSSYVLEQAAELALDIGQTETALDFADSLSQLQPENPRARHLIGNILWSQGDAEGARESYEEALKLDPAFSDALYSLGNLLSSTSPAEARDYFLRYLELNPDSAADIQYQVASLEHGLGELESARKRLEEAVRLDPDFLQARFSLAQLFENQKDTAAAYGQYEALLPLDPQNVGLLVRIGELDVQAGRREAAVERFEAAVQLEPGHPGGRFWLAFLAEEDGDFEAAAAQLSRSAALAEDASLNMRLSYYLTQAGKLAEAVEVLTAAQTRWPDDSEVAYFLGLGLDDLGRAEEAARAMARAVELKPDSREARFQLGALLEKLDRIEDAEREFRVLLDRRPQDAVVLNYLGYSLADRGLKLREAEGLIRTAVALDPENGAYLDSLAWVHHRLGQGELAFEEIRRAARLVPDDEVVWDHLGDIAESRGEAKEAWHAWQRAGELAGAAAPYAPKIERAEAGLSNAEVARLFLRLFGETHGERAELHALCDIKGEVGPGRFELQGLLGYDRGEGKLKLDVLGPFLIPLWRLSHGEGGADLGGLSVPELDPAAFEQAAGTVLELLHAYFRGDFFRDDGEPRYKRGWSRRWVETGAHTLFFPKDSTRLKSVRPKAARRLLFEVGEPVEGRDLPSYLRIAGPGFKVTLELRRVSRTQTETN